MTTGMGQEGSKADQVYTQVTMVVNMMPEGSWVVFCVMMVLVVLLLRH